MFDVLAKEQNYEMAKSTPEEVLKVYDYWENTFTLHKNIMM